MDGWEERYNLEAINSALSPNSLALIALESSSRFRVRSPGSGRLLLGLSGGPAFVPLPLAGACGQLDP